MQDLGCHLAWVIGWFIVSVEWVVSARSVGHTFSSILNEAAAGCTHSQDTNVQANIAAVSYGTRLFIDADLFGRTRN